MRLTEIVLATVLMSVSVLAQACDLAPVKIVQSVGKVDDVTVNFGEADDPNHPIAWQGPLQIATGAAPACSVNDEVSIIEQPVMFGDGVLYVSTYSGSNNRIYALDAKTCKTIWRSGSFSTKPVFKKRKIVMGGKTVLIDKHCRPIALRDNSSTSSTQLEK